nr:immunoglobulin heavy chain junction region [Macaca mulatta]MOW46030.1 immunoglobulin heavy chain junction region [Macaca mulatta]MOW46070.1 immunoglobulin heavy chain junction region [Macaca mulatta]MOW46120.1 immunoglobulin heavy chain junction region [Macaca mulatta]MOW46164.1 immunoglobulin heavy chain junction region [Macaca mulatta]
CVQDSHGSGFDYW